MEPARKDQPASQQSFLSTYTVPSPEMATRDTERNQTQSVFQMEMSIRKHTQTPFQHSKIQSVKEPKGRRWIVKLLSKVIPELNLQGEEICLMKMTGGHFGEKYGHTQAMARR